jgi:hypothetical protein
MLDVHSLNLFIIICGSIMIAYISGTIVLNSMSDT